MGRAWAVSVALAGVLLVGVVYGCTWYAIPHRPAARDRPIYGLLLLGPYLLAALGCWLSCGRLTRALAVLTLLAGMLIAGGAVIDAWPTFGGGPPPDMPASALLAGVLLVGQYWAGVIAALEGLAGRPAARAVSDATPDRDRT